MALKNKNANRPAKGCDWPDMLGLKDPKLALMFVQACIQAVAMGEWITIGCDRQRTTMLVTMKDSSSEVDGIVSATDLATLKAALEEFASDIASMAASKGL